MADKGGTYSWTGSGFTTKSPAWSSGTWSSGWWKSGSGKKEKKYKSSLGYSDSSFYDYSSSSYYGKWSSTYTNVEDAEAVERLLTSAYKSVREAVVILDFPFKVDICFSGNTFFRESKDKARKIFLATKSLDDKERSDAEKIDVLCGNGIHEASHLKYTELRVLKTFQNSIKLSGEFELVDVLTNIIEDERVEDRLLKERPGYENYITKKKEFDYNKIDFSKSDKSLKLIYDILKFIRFRSKFNEESITGDLVNLYYEVDHQLQENIYNNETSNTKSSCLMAKNLSSLIITFLKDQWGETISGGAMKLLEREKSKLYTLVLSGLDEEELDTRLLSALEKEQTTLVSGDSLEIREKLANGAYERCDKTFIINDIEGDLDVYERIKKQISPYVPALKKILVAQDKNYDFVIHGCRSGLLDTTKLAEAYQGVPQVYTRIGHVRTNRTAVCVLVDESGSMGRTCGGMQKDRIARKTAVLFNEAFGSIPGVDLFIYGHTADYLENHTTQLNVYREPGMGIDRYSAMSEIRALYENRDGDAILTAAKRVRKKTSSKCTMFVISDGCPCADEYWGESALRDTRKKILQAQALDFNIIGICIDSVPEMSNMYDSWIDISSDLSQFPVKLGRIVKKTIMDSRSTVTS